jgi:hypothetical protein
MIQGHMFDRYGHAREQFGGVEQQVARLDRINAFYSEIDRMFVPYMRLDQRMPLWWWPALMAKIKRGGSWVRTQLRLPPH